MSERTATLAIEALDKDKWAVHRSVHEIMHLLHEYIPKACLHEAEDRLFDMFFINGVEITSNIMRKEYEEWKRLELNVLSMSNIIPKVQP